MGEYEIRLRETDKKKIYIDPSEREGVYLYPSEVRRLKLKEGCRLSEEDLEAIRRQVALPRAKKRAMGILAKRDKTENQLREKLQESLHDSRSIEEAISFLKDCGYLDDRRYVEDYLYSKRTAKSFRVIRQDLLRKGIASGLIDWIFEEKGPQTGEDLMPLMTRYLRKFPEPDREARYKIMQHFLRKGYPADLVREVLETCLEEEGPGY